MTSEIAVMNQRCVALAADSAVTLIDGKKVVVRNDQRKLFDLAAGVPIGVMFFGVADLMGHPWDVLIEHFRKKGRAGLLPHVRDHAVKFTGALDNLEEFFPRSGQKDDYRRLLASVFRFLLQLAQFIQENSAKEGRNASKDEILRQAIDLVWQRYRFLEDGTARRDLPCFPQGFGTWVAKEHADVIDAYIAQGFSNYALDAAAQQKLRDIAVFCVVKDLFLEDVTGLVFAGYGAADRYPSVVTYNVSAVVGGIVKRSEIDVETIDGEMRSAITLFADSEAIYAFLRGIELDLEMRLYGTMQAMNEGLVDQVLDAVGDLDPARREAIRGQFRSQHLPQYLNRFYSMLSDYQQKAYLDPVLHVLEIATRQDMAETAQDLVALNIFKKRIMARQPTVGGAIDVAVISREDGFQWWKKQGARP
jgi:hypothetical protein